MSLAPFSPLLSIMCQGRPAKVGGSATCIRSSATSALSYFNGSGSRRHPLVYDAQRCSLFPIASTGIALLTGSDHIFVLCVSSYQPIRQRPWRYKNEALDCCGRTDNADTKQGQLASSTTPGGADQSRQITLSSRSEGLSTLSRTRIPTDFQNGQGSVSSDPLNR